MTIKISGHPPFPAQVILNGHEYAAAQAAKRGISFTKEGNCFTHISDAAGLARVADALCDSRTIGRLSRVCERWIYTCLSFALDSEEQAQSGFRYQYSSYQVEYSRNLIFRAGAKMERVLQALVDRTRSLLGVERVKTILGRKQRPRYRPRQKQGRRWEVVVERPTYDLTVFKVHWGRLTLKTYTKGERVLRIEALAHNTEELRRGRDLSKFPLLVARLQQILERFLEALHSIDVCFIADETLEQLPLPAQLGQTRVGGIDLNKPRLRKVVEALVTLSPSPVGLTASQVATKVSSLGLDEYGARRAAYDLKKFRAKQLVDKKPFSRRYQVSPQALQALTALLVLREKVIKPLLAAGCHPQPRPRRDNLTPLDQHYENLRLGMQGLFQELGLVA